MLFERSTTFPESFSIRHIQVLHHGRNGVEKEVKI
jgi:hypothetical protein